jgi:hypothetical protein
MLDGERVIDAEPAPESLGRQVRANALGPAGLTPLAETLTLRLCGERRLARWYAALGENVAGPARCQLFADLAAEVAHRADASAACLRRVVRGDPGMLPAVLRLALWMARAGGGTGGPEGATGDHPDPSRGGDPHCIRRMLTLRRMLAG